MRLAAGLVHEAHGLDDLVAFRDHVERLVGRRDRARAEADLELRLAVAEA